MLFYFACEAAGASAPGIPHALSQERRKSSHNSDAFAPRERRHSRPPLRHCPRRRAIQYCRGADDQSRSRGVLDTRFRGYDDWAGLQKRPFAHASAANVTRGVIAREGGRSSIAEELMINREAAAYWIPAFAGMTAGLRQTQTVCACERRRMSLAVSSPAKAGDPVLQRSR